MAQLKVKQISDFVSAVASVHNGVVGTTTATAISTAKTEAILDAATAGDLAYDTLGSASSAQNAAGLDATSKANAAKSEAISAASLDATSKANTAESEAIASAKSYSDGLASNYDAAGSASDAQTAAGLDATSKANAAKSEAINTSKEYSDGLAKNYDAAGSADTAKSEAIAAAAVTAESKDAARALTTTAAIKVEKDRIDALLLDSTDALNSFAEIKGFVDALATADIVGLTSAISTAKTEAIAAAATAGDLAYDTLGSASSAQSAAISAAGLDATSKANAAKSEAIAAARLDATNKADKALSDAKADATTKADKALSDAKADATAKDNVVLSTLRGEIATLAGTSKIEQVATFINGTQFYVATAVSDSNKDILVYVNGLQIHRSSVSIDGFAVTNGGFNFQVSNLGYSLESNDHIIVIGVEADNQVAGDDPVKPKDLTELPV